LRKQKLEILLVEDSREHALITKLLFSGCEVEHQIHTVVDGKEALDFLFKRHEHREAKTPDLILLDLDLPIVDGREVLRQVRLSPLLKSIPVLVLSAYATDDGLFPMGFRADSYYEKPASFAHYRALVQEIEDKWLKVLAS
jgi:CheY-like chemotaxis protein